ncbi:hypothetical protein ACRZTK_004419 [Enterobacter asburiae]
MMVSLWLCMVSGVQAATESAPASDNGVILLAATGEATITLTPRTNILEGLATGGLILASWQASATVGSIAFRLNPAVVKQYTTPTYLDGYIQMAPSPIAQIEIYVDHDCGSTTLTGTWRVCPAGKSSVSGYIRTKSGLTQTLRGGTYPIAMDAVAWTP